jgi:hypothetical protein
VVQRDSFAGDLDCEAHAAVQWTLRGREPLVWSGCVGVRREA